MINTHSSGNAQELYGSSKFLLFFFTQVLLQLYRFRSNMFLILVFDMMGKVSRIMLLWMICQWSAYIKCEDRPRPMYGVEQVE